MRYLRLSSHWKMRREETQVVLVLLSTLEVQYISLKPYMAVVLALLDGKTPESKIINKLSVWFHKDGTQVSETLNFIINDLNKFSKNFKIIDILSAPSPSQTRYDVRDFIIPQKSYHFQTKLNSPSSALLYLTGSCQTNCRYCYADTENLRQYPRLSYEEWVPILKDLRTNQTYNLTFAGGDSGAHPEYAKILAAACDSNTLVFFSTKCLVSYQSAKIIADGGWNRPVNGGVQREFQLSIDTLDEKTSEYLLGVKDFPRRAALSVKNLLEVGIKPKIKGVMTPFNYRHVENLVNYFSGKGVRSFFFSHYNDSFYRHEEGLRLKNSHKQELKKLLEQLANDHEDITIEGEAIHYQPSTSRENTEVLSNKSLKKNWKQRSNCSAGRNNLIITPDGKVLLCEQLPSKKDFVVGDLTRQSIKEVWNSEALHTITHPTRESFQKTICFGCKEFDDCINTRGQCFRDNYFDFGVLYHPQKKCPYYASNHA